jgi:hypothetical protein
LLITYFSIVVIVVDRARIVRIVPERNGRRQTVCSSIFSSFFLPPANGRVITDPTPLNGMTTAQKMQRCEMMMML